MRGLNCIFLVGGLMVSGVSCKTRRPLVEIEESVKKSDSSRLSSSPISATQAVLRITSLSLPIGSAPYSRVSITLIPKLKSEQIDPNNPIGKIEFANYEMRSEKPILAGVTYEIIVTTYLDNKAIYSNTGCKNAKQFTSKAGLNNFTVPMCSINDVPSTDEGEPIGTSSDD
ncbi:MAG: hypothetical protein EOP10_05550 [Proteobacteria bacterium]|nr:MAG: hypothetical protein EOP10_05550 [Pseudomonadota bacterium]